MKGSSLNIDKMLYDDAANIDIDMKFKDDLKKRIMASAVVKEKTVIELPRRSRTPHLKVAGWVVFAALSGSTIFGAGSLYSHLVANSGSINPAVTETNKNQSEPAKNSSDSLAIVNPQPGSQTVTPAPGKEVASAAEGSSQSSGTKTAGKSNSNAGTYTAPVTKPSAGNAAGGANTSTATANTKTGTDSKQSTAAANAQEGANTSSNASQSNTVPEEKTNTIKLPLVAGRYMIQSITAAKSEVVDVLPLEKESLTADQWTKLPAAEAKEDVFEEDGKIYMVSHATKKKITVDAGQFPVEYAPINIISYIKNETTTSSVWIFDGNSATKYMLLTSESEKYSYINTSWSKDGQELYVLGFDGKTKKYEITKLTLDIK